MFCSYYVSSALPNQLPRYKNFKGVIHELGQNQYLVSGEISVIDKNTVEITELPVRTWTQVTWAAFLLDQGLLPLPDRGLLPP